jgi:DNA-binding transcriptional regulator LsrR (DeoR family)
MLSDHQRDLLAQVASMYYEQDMTQNEIAEVLGLSRVKIYRLLKQAKEAGIVHIVIDWAVQRDAALEQAICTAFGLREALVMRTSTEDSSRGLSRLGQLAARYLEGLLKEATTMAICLGRTTYEVIHAIRPDFQSRVRVVQAMGSSPYSLDQYDSSSLVRQLAQKLGGEALYLLSPAIADSSEAAVTIRSQREIKRTLNAARSADIALIDIGNLDPAISGIVKAGAMEADELLALSDAGAVGDIAWQIYRLNGELYPCDFNRRVIGITLEELLHIPTTFAVAMGVEKAVAIVGALHSRAIDVLCTDDTAVRRALEIAKQWQATQ